MRHWVTATGIARATQVEHSSAPRRRSRLRHNGSGWMADATDVPRTRGQQRVGGVPTSDRESPAWASKRRAYLSRWRHGLESRWGCDKKTKVRGPGEHLGALLILDLTHSRTPSSRVQTYPPTMAGSVREVRPGGWKMGLHTGKDPLTGKKTQASSHIRASGKPRGP